ncbi:unnamed protein product [Albugo candida]|uniref:Uncharacterized protein n=1 Tax=Albugo candida TaxID=65357 RepID=A0A024FXG6_9STRA|nr:unnamed protein product [Albugo candida]|eukprot:CCI11354.1 unnamed protein product [Albugo candida]
MAINPPEGFTYLVALHVMWLLGAYTKVQSGTNIRHELQIFALKVSSKKHSNFLAAFESTLSENREVSCRQFPNFDASETFQTTGSFVICVHYKKAARNVVRHVILVLSSRYTFSSRQEYHIKKPNYSLERCLVRNFHWT